MAVFDWDGDGKNDFTDDFLEYMIYKDVTGEDEEPDYDDDYDDLDRVLDEIKRESVLSRQREEEAEFTQAELAEIGRRTLRENPGLKRDELQKKRKLEEEELRRLNREERERQRYNKAVTLIGHENMEKLKKSYRDSDIKAAIESYAGYEFGADIDSGPKEERMPESMLHNKDFVSQKFLALFVAFIGCALAYFGLLVQKLSFSFYDNELLAYISSANLLVMISLAVFMTIRSVIIFDLASKKVVVSRYRKLYDVISENVVYVDFENDNVKQALKYISKETSDKIASELEDTYPQREIKQAMIKYVCGRLQKKKKMTDIMPSYMMADQRDFKGNCLAFLKLLAGSVFASVIAARFESYMYLFTYVILLILWYVILKKLHITIPDKYIDRRYKKLCRVLKENINFEKEE